MIRTYIVVRKLRGVGMAARDLALTSDTSILLGCAEYVDGGCFALQVMTRSVWLQYQRNIDDPGSVTACLYPELLAEDIFALFAPGTSLAKPPTVDRDQLLQFCRRELDGSIFSDKVRRYLTKGMSVVNVLRSVYSLPVLAALAVKEQNVKTR